MKRNLVYKFGCTGFVELNNQEANKYSEFDYLYWINEISILHYLWPFRTDNIIKYKNIHVKMASDPKTKRMKRYTELTFKQYEGSLADKKLYRDVEIMQVMLDLASALKFLHSKGIMHRDIKSDNVVLDNKNRALLIDFSHAHKHYTQLPSYTLTVATVFYRPPEIFAESLYNESIDIYCLGMVFLEMICTASFGHFMIDTKGADLYKSIVMCKATLETELINFYQAKKRNLVHSDKYFEWIQQMTKFDYKTRITAEALYNSILEFCKDKFDIVIPVNGELEINLQKPTLSKIVNNEELVKTCIVYVNSLKKDYELLLVPSQIYKCIRAMIEDGFITEVNYRNATAALVIILESAVFDDITSINDYGVLSNEYVKELIVDIVNKYSEHLFSYQACIKFDSVLGSVVEL